MRGILVTGTVVLVILGTGNHLWWLAAVALLYLYVTHGRGSPGTTPPAGTGAPPDSYRAYRDVYKRQSGSAATAASGPSRPGGRSGTRAGSERGVAGSHRPGAPHTGNQRPRSCSIRRSFPSVAFSCSSSAVSRRSAAPGSGANG